MRTKFLTFILAFSTGVCVYAKSGNGKISGIVKDTDGSPLVGANIWNKKYKIGTVTDGNGHFILKNLPEEELYLDIKYIGFITQQDTVSVRSTAPIKKQYTLHHNEVEIDEVIVQAPRKQINEHMPFTMSRLPVTIKEQPQTISVVDRKLMDEQGVTDIKDAILNVPGAYSWATYGGALNSFGARGYRGISFMKDGILMETSQPDMDGVDEMQVIKGSSAILFGNVSPGGIINLASKRPRATFGGNFKAGYGSFNTYKANGDIWGSLDRNSRVSFRLNGSYENGDSYRSHVSKEKFYFNPSLRWQLGRNTDLLIQYDYMNDNRTPDNGTILYDWKIYDLPFDRFTGLTSDNVGTTNQSVSATLTHRLNEKFTLRAVMNRTTEERNDYRIGNHSNVIKGTSLLKRVLTKTDYEYNHSLIQVDLLGSKVKTGSILHDLQVGMDYRMTDKFQGDYKTAVIDTIDVINGPIRNTINDLPALARDKDTRTRTSKIGFMVQDIVHFSNKLKATLGLRYTGVFSEEERFTYSDNKTKTSPKTRPQGISPSAGISYWPVQNINMFATYTNTFAPTTLRDINGGELGNQITDQFEVGFKSDWLENRLSANLTYFYIYDNNQVMEVMKQDENGVWKGQGYGEKNGKQRNQGIELEVQARPINGLNIQTGYAYIDARYLENNRYIDNAVPLNTPKHTFNLWASYAVQRGFLKGLFVGAGAYYTGKRFANDQVKIPWHGIEPGDPAVVLPAYTEVNMSLGYQYQKWRFTVSAKNLLDERAYLAYRYNFINPINPRNFNATIQYTL